MAPLLEPDAADRALNAPKDRRAFPRGAKAPGKARLVRLSRPIARRSQRRARAGVRMAAKQKPPMRQPRANASPAFSRAAALHSQGRLEEAEGLYQAILATQPNHFDVLYRLGTLRYQQGRYPEALHYVGAALKVGSARGGGLVEPGVRSGDAGPSRGGAGEL